MHFVSHSHIQSRGVAEIIYRGVWIGGCSGVQDDCQRLVEDRRLIPDIDILVIESLFQRGQYQLW